MKKERLIYFRPFFYGFLALLLGITLSRYIFMGEFSYVLIALLFLAGVTLACFKGKNFKPVVCLLIMFIAGLGLFQLDFSLQGGENYKDEVTVVGRVCEGFNDDTAGYTSVILDSVTINGKNAKNVSLMIYHPDGTKINAGELLTFNAYLKSVEILELGNLNSFYFRNNIAYTSSCQISKIGFETGYLKFDEKIRLYIKNLLFSNMSKESAATAYASLFGDKSFVSDEVYENFRDAGILHLLSVSGLHVGLLAGALAFLLKKLKVKKTWNFLIMGIILLFYAYICGFSPSVLRACIMSLVLILSVFAERPYDSLNSLGFAGIIILLLSPLSGLDIGFLMSFGSVLAIICLSQPIVNGLVKIKIPRSFANALAVCFAAQMGVLPFASQFFGNFNIFSVFVNMLIVPFFAIIYYLLFTITLVVSILPFLGFLLRIVDVFILVLLGMASLSAFEFGRINLKPLNIMLVILFFFTIFSLSFFVILKPYVKVSLVAVLMLCFTIYGLALNVPKNFESDVRVVNLSTYTEGQLLIQNEKGVVLLGFSETRKANTYLAQNNIRSVDAVFALDNFLKDDRESKSFLLSYGAYGNVYAPVQKNFSELSDFGRIDSLNLNFKYITRNNKVLAIEIDLGGKNFLMLNNIDLTGEDIMLLRAEVEDMHFDIVYADNAISAMPLDEFIISKKFIYKAGADTENCLNANKNFIIDFINDNMEVGWIV